MLWVELWLRAVRHPELRPVAEELYARLHAWFADEIAAGVERRRIRPLRSRRGRRPHAGADRRLRDPDADRRLARSRSSELARRSSARWRATSDWARRSGTRSGRRAGAQRRARGGAPGPDRALHVARDPVVRARDVERRLVGPVQRPDARQVAGRPARDVAARERVGAPRRARASPPGTAPRSPYSATRPSSTVARPDLRPAPPGTPTAARAGPAATARLGPAARSSRTATRSRRARSAPPPARTILVGDDDLRRERVALRAQRPRRASLSPVISTSRSGPAGIAQTTASASIASPSASVTSTPPGATSIRRTTAPEPEPRAELGGHRAARPPRSPRRPGGPPTLEVVEALAAERRVLAQLGEQRGALGRVADERQRRQLVAPADRRQRALLAQPGAEAERVEARGVGVSSTDRRDRRSPRARELPLRPARRRRRSASLIHGGSSPT